MQFHVIKQHLAKAVSTLLLNTCNEFLKDRESTGMLCVGISALYLT